MTRFLAWQESRCIEVTSEELGIPVELDEQNTIDAIKEILEQDPKDYFEQPEIHVVPLEAAGSGPWSQTPYSDIRSSEFLDYKAPIVRRKKPK